MNVQNIDTYAAAAVRDAGGTIEEIKGLEIMPGRYLKAYDVTMPEGTLSFASTNVMSNLEQTYFLLPTGELVKVYRNGLTQEHPDLEDAWKAEVRKAHA